MSVLDNQFKTAHHDLHRHKSDSPSQDKELGDSALLNPVLSASFLLTPGSLFYLHWRFRFRFL